MLESCNLGGPVLESCKLGGVRHSLGRCPSALLVFWGGEGGGGGGGASQTHQSTHKKMEKGLERNQYKIIQLYHRERKKIDKQLINKNLESWKQRKYTAKKQKT